MSKKFKVQIVGERGGKALDRTFTIVAPSKERAYGWGHKQADYWFIVLYGIKTDPVEE